MARPEDSRLGPGRGGRASDGRLIIQIRPGRGFARFAGAGSAIVRWRRGWIRTHGTLARTPDFESGPFDHSGTPPRGADHSVSSATKRAHPFGISAPEPLHALNGSHFFTSCSLGCSHARDGMAYPLQFVGPLRQGTVCAMNHRAEVGSAVRAPRRFRFVSRASSRSLPSRSPLAPSPTAS